MNKAPKLKWNILFIWGGLLIKSLHYAVQRKRERERDLFPVLNKRVQSLRNRGEWNSQVEFAIEHARTGLMVLST